ncbi:DUF3310 domain-containing protein [Sporosarcina sp. E16_3]|nr:DUF3310 domain-containing protein [Sporosarcina sp. E16_3]
MRITSEDGIWYLYGERHEEGCDFGKYELVEEGVNQTQADAVHSPQHYTQGGVEVIDIIRQATDGAGGFEGLCLGNVIKYTMRYRHKNGVEDLRKARVYLDWLIDELEAKQ